MELINKDELLDRLEELKQNLSASPIVVIENVESLVESLEVKKIPSWKKTMHDNGCWSCEIGVNPSKRLYEYEHYTINADELFKLLDKED